MLVSCDEEHRYPAGVTALVEALPKLLDGLQHALEEEVRLRDIWMDGTTY